MSNFLKRAITGSIFVIAIIGCLLLGKFTFVSLFFLITVLGLWEFYRVSEKGPNQPQKIMGTILGSVIFLCNALIGMGYFNFPLLIINIPLLYLLFITELYLKHENPFRNIGFTLLGIFYVAVPFSMLNYIVFHKGFYDYEILLGFFFILWANDTGAYLVGSRIGKNKMFERVSPGKTWEGTIGGGILGLIVAYLISLLFSDLQTIEWLIIATLLIVIGTVGDLVQSIYKRSKNIKDSGSILPGHGGILDRFDSLLLATPFVFTYLFILRYLH